MPGTRYGTATCALVLMALALAVRLDAQPLAKREGAVPKDPNIVVDPSLLTEVHYRSLEFNRGGRVTAVAGVAGDPLTYYFGASGGGVWKTRNAGLTWTPLTDGQLEAGGIGAIAVAESDANVIYVGTGSACPRGNVSAGIGMYGTKDGGRTWKHIGLRTAGQIGKIRIHPKIPDTLYVAALGNIFGQSKDRGVYRSRDGGATWQKVLFISDRTGAIDLAMDPSNPRILYATMWTVERKPWSLDSGSKEGGIFKSSDGGDTWTRLTGGLPADVTIGKIGVTVSPVNPDRVWAIVEAAEEKSGVYRSDDAGKTWQLTNARRELLQRAWYYMHIVADPGDANVVYVLNTFFFKSTDGGKTFATLNMPKNDTHDLWINPQNPRAMVIGDDGGGAVSLTGGDNWTSQHNQATAEIYRVAVDSRHPYRVYGAQQDNTTVAIDSFEPPSHGGINFTDVGGCESGHIAVDPGNPHIVYAGCFGGALARTDTLTGISESVQVYPEERTGHRASDMKYRFQWNFPIRVSSHAPHALYATSQYVHRSKDAGHSWEVISGDLTRNDRSRQDYSGGKSITPESAGVEVYGTIFAFEESPTTAGLLWAGSDDGRVHVSRDDGASWTDVTPSGMPDFGCVNAIDPSAHDPGRATIAVFRYRQNDFTPYIFQTTDYGKSWTRLTNDTNGIPPTHFVRVVREDPDRRGLLYAGTEFGMYVSFDNGAHWQSFQLNLPVTPVTDLKVHRKDLVVSTQGRAFWVIDDLSLLHQISESSIEKALLLKPRDAYRGRNSSIYYYFAQPPTQEVTLEILDASGAVVSSYSGKPGVVPAGPSRPPGYPPDVAVRRVMQVVTLKRGVNRFTWTLTQGEIRKVPDGTVRGPRVVPGQYQVRLTSGNWSQTQPLTVSPHPGVKTSLAEYQENDRLAKQMLVKLRELYEKLAALRDAKEQAAHLGARVEAAGKGDDIAKAAKSMVNRLTQIEQDMIQLRGIGGQDSYYFPGKLDEQILEVYYEVTGDDMRASKGSIDRWNDLQPAIAATLYRAEQAVKNEVAAFNALVRSRKIDPIIIK